MSIVDDFSDIARRLNRKRAVDLMNTVAVQDGEPQAMSVSDDVVAVAAIKTLQSLGYTYTYGAMLWKPPLGAIPKDLTESFENAQMAALRAEVEQMERKLDLQTVNEAKFQRYKAES